MTEIDEMQKRLGRVLVRVIDLALSRRGYPEATDPEDFEVRLSEPHRVAINRTFEDRIDQIAPEDGRYWAIPATIGMYDMPSVLFRGEEV